MPYCENCGSPVNTNAKFCSNCGEARSPVASNKEKTETKKSVEPKRQRLNYYSPPRGVVPSAPKPILGTQPALQQPYQAPPMMQQAPPIIQPQQTYQPQNSGETTIGVIQLRRTKSLGRYETFAGVITNQRLIFAQITGEMMKQATIQSRDQAKAEGKGFFGQWADQLKGTFGYTKKYFTMPHQAILNETPGNFTLYNNAITEIKIHLKGDHNDHNNQREFEAEIRSTSGNYKFRMNEDSNLTDLLKRVYGNRVKMPFGYFSKTIKIG